VTLFVLRLASVDSSSHVEQTSPFVRNEECGGPSVYRHCVGADVSGQRVCV